VEDLVIELLVRGDDPCFEGHFPGAPTLAASAQLALLILPAIETRWPELGAPREVRRLKLHAAIRPGDALTLTLAPTPDGIRFDLRRGPDLCTSGMLVR
jgi:3-hydroxymyristoyl/3-hydroxydecanoyl-(acyl carrier protein) dehydratase